MSDLERAQSSDGAVDRSVKERLSTSLLVSDILVAKALGVSEIAQISRIERTTRELLLTRWNSLAAKAVREATRGVSGEGKFTATDAKKYAKTIEMVMSGWAGSVLPRFKTSIEMVYRLAREAGAKRALGEIKKPLTYDTSHLVQKAEAPAVGIIARFDVIDEEALASINGQNTFWIGEHYGKNVKSSIESSAKQMVERGVSRREAGRALAKDVKEKLGKISVPRGFKGTSASYFEGVTANAMTTARVTGQMRSFAQTGVATYEIVNPIDERTCPVCGHMNGKRFTIAEGTTIIDGLLSASTPDEVKSAQPWLTTKQMKEISPTPGDAGRADGEVLAGAKFAMPPFHFRCRCTVDVDRFVETTPIPPPAVSEKPSPKRIATKAGWVNTLTKEEKDAFMNWSWNGYHQMREYDSGKVPASWIKSKKVPNHPGAVTNAQAAEHLRLMRKAMETAPLFEGTVYRGISSLSVEVAESMAKKGAVFEMEAISSASKSRAVAKEFAVGANMDHTQRFITMEIRGAKGVDISHKDIVYRTKEKEVLLEKGKKYKVVSVRSTTIEGGKGAIRKKKGFHLVMEEI